MPLPDPEDRVELSSVSRPEPDDADASTAPPKTGTPKPFLQLWFRCANHYARAYKSPDNAAYVGRCPLCAQTIRFPIGQGGTSQRTFTVSCR